MGVASNVLALEVCTHGTKEWHTSKHLPWKYRDDCDRRATLCLWEGGYIMENKPSHPHKPSQAIKKDT